MRALMRDLARGAFTYAPPTLDLLERAIEERGVSRKRSEAALKTISKRRGGHLQLESAMKVLTERYDIQSGTEEQARLLLFAKLDELASEAESDDIEKRQQARLAILGFVMLLEKVASDSYGM